MSTRTEIGRRLQIDSFANPREALANALWCLHAALSIHDETAFIYAELSVRQELTECYSKVNDADAAHSDVEEPDSDADAADFDVDEPHSDVDAAHSHVDAAHSVDIGKICSLLNRLYKKLHTITCDVPKAWVPFHVGILIMSNKTCQDLDASSYFTKSLELAQTDWLRLYATMALANWFSFKDNLESRLKYNMEKIELSAKLENQPLIADALLDCLLIYDRNSDIEEMLKIQNKIKCFEDMYNPLHEAFKWTTMALDVVLSFALGEMEACIKKSKEAVDYLGKIPHSDQDIATYFSSESTESLGYIAEAFLFRCRLTIGNIGKKAFTIIGFGHTIRPEKQWSSMLGNMYEKYNIRSGYIDRNREMMDLFQKSAAQMYTLVIDNIDEAETNAKRLLSLSEEEPFVQPIYRSWALVFLASVSLRRTNGMPIEDGLAQEMEILFLEAEKSVSGYVLLQMKMFHGYCLYCQKEYDRAESELRQSIELFLELESQTPLSKGRINRLDIISLSFHVLERICYRKDDLHGALIWNEMGHSRDLTYHIANHILVGPTLSNLESPLPSPCNLESNLEFTWQEIQKALAFAGDDTAFLIYSWKSPMVEYVSHIFHRHLTMSIVHEFGPIMNEFLCRDPTPNPSKKFVDEEDLQMLFHYLIKPWEEDLEKLSPKRLIIIPSPVFSRIPFAALYDSKRDDGKPYLIQRYEVINSPSMRLFYQCEAMRLKSSSHLQDKRVALVVGNPKTKKLAILKEAEAEAENVGGYLKKTMYEKVYLLKDSQATREEVERRLPECDWIHIAAHAIVNEDNPHGAIFLAHSSGKTEGSGSSDLESQPKDRSAADECELLSEDDEECELVEIFRLGGCQDKTLSAADIASVTQLRASAVVLSCCMSGLGEPSQEGTLGLFRSLHMTGVPTVVCSLWKVQDISTRYLMEKLYSNLSAGHNIATALQQAMISMIEENHPFDLWAPFIVSGSPFTRLGPFFHSSPKIPLPYTDFRAKKKTHTFKLVFPRHG